LPVTLMKSFLANCKRSLAGPRPRCGQHSQGRGIFRHAHALSRPFGGHHTAGSGAEGTTLWRNPRLLRAVLPPTPWTCFSPMCSPAHPFHSGDPVGRQPQRLCRLGMMLSLMEGFRRAYRIPADAWGFWGRRGWALLLVPIALVPLSLATLVIVFGHQIEAWMIDNADHELRHIVLFFGGWRVVGRIGHQRHCPYRPLPLRHQAQGTLAWVVPGAITGTLLWFPSTLAFGWYVTRIANYSRFYGSFGARHRHAGLALHYRLQCPHRGGVERRPLSGSAGADCRLVQSDSASSGQ